MPIEKIKTYRSGLRKLAFEAGLDPDNLTKSQLSALESLEKSASDLVHIKVRRFRERAVELGLNPDAISRHDYYAIMRGAPKTESVHS